MTKDATSHELKAELAGEILTTASLVLRPPHQDDAQDIAALANNYNVASMLKNMPYPYFDADAQEFIDRISKKSSDAATYAITLKATGELIGICSLHASESRYGIPYIGYWIGEPYWGQGYATEAARALVDFFFKAGSQEALLFSVLSENLASKRVIEKCGGKFWKLDNGYSPLTGENQKIEHFRITRENWMGAIAA